MKTKNMFSLCRYRILSATLLLVGFLGSVPLSLADSLTLSFEGNVNETQVFPGFPNASKKAAFDKFLGSSFRLSVTFENNPLLNPDRNPLDPNVGEYNLTTLSGSVMGQTVTANSGTLYVGNNDNLANTGPIDYFSGHSRVPGDVLFGPTVGGFPPLIISFGFFDPSGMAFDNDGLPQGLVKPSRFLQGSAYLDLTFGRPTQPFITDFGEIIASYHSFVHPNNLIRVAPVPEASTVTLLGSGLVGLFGWQYRKNLKN